MVMTLQFEDIVGLLGNPTFLWSLLAATWGVISYRIIRRRRHGPKTGPTQASGAVSFMTKPSLSEEEIIRILTTTEVNIQIVRICETPKSAKEVAKALGDVYPGHKEKGFPAEKLGEHLGKLERLGAVKFNGEKWAASDVGVKMVKKYFGLNHHLRLAPKSILASRGSTLSRFSGGGSCQLKPILASLVVLGGEWAGRRFS